MYTLGINCVPGTFTSNTGCQNCPNGTYSDRNNATKCAPCDKCVGKYNEMIKPCTSSSNAKCSCQPGYYYNTGFTFCLKCVPCRRGQGVVRNCTATSNTVCDPCEKVRDEEFFCDSDEHDISPYFTYALSSTLKINGIDLTLVQAHLNASFSLQNQIKNMFTSSALKMQLVSFTLTILMQSSSLHVV